MLGFIDGAVGLSRSNLLDMILAVEVRRDGTAGEEALDALLDVVQSCARDPFELP